MPFTEIRIIKCESKLLFFSKRKYILRCAVPDTEPVPEWIQSKFQTLENSPRSILNFDRKCFFPYFFLMKWLPGFDQLKNVYRFGLLCAVVLPLPVFALVQRRWACLITILYLSITTFPHQYMERHPNNSSLSSITKGAVCFLPLGTHSPNWMIKDAAQHELRIINPPSFEKGTDTLTPMYLDHPLLNQLALLSNYTDVDILHLATIDKDDIMALQEQNIRWFALPKGKPAVITT